MAGDQKLEMVESRSGIIFFLFKIHIHYFFIYTGNFQKIPSPPRKKPIPTQNLNLT